MPPRVSLSLALRAVIACLVTAVSSWPQGRAFQGKVIAVTDGDTLRVLVNRTPVTLRLYGVDCPEKQQPYGTRAKQFTSALSFGRDIMFTVISRDRNGRFIANVTLPNGQNLSQEIVRSGAGWWFRQYAPADHLLRTLEEQARRNRRGLWAAPHPIAPWEWRLLRRR